MEKDISSYNASQNTVNKAICDSLRSLIDASLPTAERKIWHGSPVWFLEGNPVVGYAVRKTKVTLLFWSGQSFIEKGLTPEGSFKAAEAHYTEASQIDENKVRAWLKDAVAIQWDYKNIVKKRGVLDRLK